MRATRACNPDRPPSDGALLLKRAIAGYHALLLYDNAAFLAERLLALEWSVEAAYWVAQSHFLLADYAHVYHFLKPLHPFAVTFPAGRDSGVWQWRLLHVWGVCCVRLHRYQAAEQVFAHQAALLSYTATAMERAAHHYYRGLVARRLQDAKGAAKHLMESCANSPFLFCAFEEACTAGHAAHADPAAVFSDRAAAAYLAELQPATSPADPDDPEGDEGTMMVGIEGPEGPASSPPPRSTLTRVAAQTASRQKATPASRRAPRSGSATATPQRPPLQPTVSSSIKRPRPLPGCYPAEEPPITAAAARGLLQLLAAMGEAFRLLCLYKCPESIQAIQCIPEQQANTGWVLALLGKAFLELGDYPEACATFQRLRKAEPYCMDGMVEYSTALYQLKRDKELSALAQTMADQDRNSAHTLCVLANCFSLAGDHEMAVKFLRRATAQAPAMWYPHTLLGHEHFILDDLEEALQQYRHAMLMNPSHYNAWYGLGQVYMKQEQYAQAQHYFSVAIKLNGNCSPLYVHLATTLQQQEKYREALDNLRLAIRLQPANLLARLKRAQLNLGLNKTAEALQELEYLRDRAPKEAQIYVTLGKCYQRMGLGTPALQCLHLALDLEPKENPAIKRLMEMCLAENL